MDTDLLKTFLQVSKLRHFGRAADNLFITQSAVSARIKLLEETLGVDLFIRKRNDIELTPAGTRLHQHAENILKGWERARMAVALDPDLSASLAIGCVFDLWAIYVERWIKQLGSTSPDIALQIDIQTQELLVQRLTLGIIDLAFMFDPPQAPELEFRQIANVPLVLVSTKPGISVDKALQNNYIMVDWGSAFSVKHADNFPDIPAPMYRTNSGQIALGLLQDRGGSAYLPRQQVTGLIQDNIIHEVMGSPVIDRFAYIVYRSEIVNRPSIRQALETLNLS
ncbi:MAG: LysR family transcriptional regulator [Gammaproteobacteria bacterium]|nr:LysR family transcriptional regulator [Gammaproteobacteria bacterium]